MAETTCTMGVSGTVVGDITGDVELPDGLK